LWFTSNLIRKPLGGSKPKQLFTILFFMMASLIFNNPTLACNDSKHPRGSNVNQDLKISSLNSPGPWGDFNGEENERRWHIRNAPFPNSQLPPPPTADVEWEKRNWNKMRKAISGKQHRNGSFSFPVGQKKNTIENISLRVNWCAA
jgi:hypothetical protein